MFSSKDPVDDGGDMEKAKSNTHPASLKKSSCLRDFNESALNIKPKKFDVRGSGKHAKVKKEQCKLKRPDKLLYIPRARRLQKETLVMQTADEVLCRGSTDSGNDVIIRTVVQKLDSFKLQASEISANPTLINKTPINAKKQTYCEETCKSDSRGKSCLSVEDDNYTQEVNITMNDMHKLQTKLEAEHQLKPEAECIVSSCSNENSVPCSSNQNLIGIYLHAGISDYANKSCVESVLKGPCTSIAKISQDKANPQLELLDDSLVKAEYNVRESASLDVEDDSWDSMFNDQGDCINPEALKELTAVVGNAKAELAKNDYVNFTLQNEDSSTKETVDAEDYSHIVELHGFPTEFTTQDLVSALSCFKSEDFTIKWVNDNHALAVFSGPFLTMQALQLEHPFVKVRPVSQGCKASKLRAKRYIETLQPARQRPATSATLARRLVTGALGLKANVPKEQREKEKQKILEAKARRQETAKQRRNMWDGVVP